MSVARFCQGLNGVRVFGGKLSMARKRKAKYGEKDDDPAQRYLHNHSIKKTVTFNKR
jgi:hypothetical protein